MSGASGARCAPSSAAKLQFALMAEKGNGEIVEEFFKALNDGDWDRLESWLDADFVWEMPQSGGDLKGLTGKGGFGAPMGSKGKYTLTYELAD